MAMAFQLSIKLRFIKPHVHMRVIPSLQVKIRPLHKNLNSWIYFLSHFFYSPCLLACPSKFLATRPEASRRLWHNLWCEVWIESRLDWRMAQIEIHSKKLSSFLDSIFFSMGSDGHVPNTWRLNSARTSICEWADEKNQTKVALEKGGINSNLKALLEPVLRGPYLPSRISDWKR